MSWTYLMSWKDFIEQELRVPQDDPIRLCDWVHTLVKGALLPALKQKGYAISVDEQTLINCILNTLFRHEKDNHKNRFTGYMCPHGRQSRDKFAVKYDAYLEIATNKNRRSVEPIINPLMERNQKLEFFLVQKCPMEFWAELRHKYPVERYADNEEFADRVWNDLPMVILWHLNHEASAATEELEDLLRIIDEEEESESSPEEA